MKSVENLWSEKALQKTHMLLKIIIMGFFSELETNL